MANYVCSNLICQYTATFSALKAFFVKKTCPRCGHPMVQEGSSKLKTSTGTTPSAHVGGPAIRLPEPPLHARSGGSGSGGRSGPTLDLTSLKQGVSSHQTRVKTNAVVNKSLVYTMTPVGGGSIQNYDMPVKYECYKSGLAKQDLEFTIRIPVKVYSGADAHALWVNKGYSSSSFYKTAWGDEPGVTGATFSDEVRRKWSAKANKCWGKAGVIWTKPGGEILQYRLRFEFVVVDDAADAAAEVACVTTSGRAAGVNPSGTIDAVRWGVNDIDPDTIGPICHEVGHLIGNPDEYGTIEYEGQTRAWGDGYQTGMGIMNNPDNPPLIRNYKPLALELANGFSIPLAEAELVQNLATISSSTRHRLNAHIWA